MKHPTSRSFILSLCTGLSLLCGSLHGQANLLSHFAFDGDFANAAAAPDGTAIGDPGFVEGPPGFGQAVALDGIDDAVGTTVDGLPEGDGLYPANPLTRGTIAFWVKTASNQRGAETSLFGTYNDSGDGTAVNLRQNVGSADSFGFMLRDENGEVIGLSASDAAWRSGQWTHYAMTWNAWPGDGKTKATNVKFFVNGVDRTGRIFSNETIDRFSPWDHPPVIGARNVRGTLGQFFEGAIDDFRVYDRALKQGDIETIMRPGGSLEGTTDDGTTGEIFSFWFEPEAETV